ncbi:adenylate kinase-like protein 1 [Hepatocystis sp. ex Piliocolobus tephrosceles]|nr:adenylate kinase-like protein 1 [Hepatocystis sp. ex Piliocolobus tephrosceles]
MGKKLPNIIITGVPCVGKTTLCEELVEIINNELEKRKQEQKKRQGQEHVQEYCQEHCQEHCQEQTIKNENNSMKYLNLSKIIKEERLYEEYDDELDASVYSEELLSDKLQKLQLNNGGFIIDFHSVTFIEDINLINRIFLLTADTNILYERSEKRNYSKEKITNNIESEIFKVIQEDILEHFGESSIYEELQNNNIQQYEQNLNLIKNWVLNYVQNQE